MGRMDFSLNFGRICPPKTSMYQLWSGELMVTYWTWLLVSRSTYESDRGLSSQIGKVAKNWILHLTVNRLGLGQPVSWRKNFIKKTSFEEKNRGTNSFKTPWRYDSAANSNVGMVGQNDHLVGGSSSHDWIPQGNGMKMINHAFRGTWETHIEQAGFHGLPKILGRFEHCPQTIYQPTWVLNIAVGWSKKPWCISLVPIGKANGWSGPQSWQFLR